jgi:broad-specificity NMP kinase
MIIHVNGWPGTGKQTIGHELATRIGARLVHNHLLHDVAIVCCGRTTPERWDLFEAVRAAAYSYLRRLPSSETLVMTNALCERSEREQLAWRHVVDLAIDRNVTLIPVVLNVELTKNIRRLQSSERPASKLKDPDVLRGYLLIDTIQRPDVPELLVMDATALSPQDAASRIIQHVEKVGEWAMPATKKHLNMG